MKDLADSDVLRLVDRIYGCSIEPQLWEEFLREVSEALDCRIASFFLQDLRSDAARVDHVVGAAPEMVRLYEDYYCRRNIFLQRAEKELRTGFVATDAYLDSGELLRSEYYNDYFARFGVRYSLGACVVRERRTMSMLTLLRSRRQGPFDHSELRLCKLLLPHLQRAVAVHRRLRQAAARQDLAQGGLESLPLGVVLIDGRGSVLFANRSARGIARKGDGLLVGEGGVKASHREDDRSLQAVIAGVRSGKLESGRGALALRRPSLKPPLSALVVRLPRSTADSGPPLAPEEGAAALFVTDPRSPVLVDRQVLRDLYGLTDAEAEVAQRLLAAASPTDIAEDLGVSIHTVRTHLKRIFAKTDTRGQKDLVRILAGGVPAMSRRDL